MEYLSRRCLTKLNNSKEYYGNLFKNDELFKSDVSLTEATKIIESQIENEE